MSTVTNELGGFSQALVSLVERTSQGVVAVKAAPYRVVSGVVIREDLIAVANHTLRREGGIPVQAADGTQAVGAILGRDASVDVAFLRVEALKVKPLEPRDPAALKSGMLAAVVGLTIDAGPSASLGIVGAVGGSRPTWRGGRLDHFLRLDVNLYPSQSGAAVVDSEGGLIGMATPALLRHSALALDLSTINRIVNELLQEGRIRHGYLGVGLQPVRIPAALQEKIGVNSESGLIVLNVEPDSPAAKANVQLGDILLSLDDKPMSDVDELQASLRGDNVGRTARVVILRGGEVVTAGIAIAERAKRGK